MRSCITFLFILFLSSTYAQNVNDAYDDHTNDFVWGDDLDTYTGEYKTFLDKHFWAYFNNDPSNPVYKVSYGFEIVSFPFIPEEFEPNGSNYLANHTPRDFNMRVISDGYYGSIHTNGGVPINECFEGLGWEYGDYYIFSKVKNTNGCAILLTGKECVGDIGLISEVFADDNYIDPNDPGKCVLPHTVIRHTLYFHCLGNNIDKVIDSISWIYDNTRGKMKEYPFIPTETPVETTKNTLIDVVFRPTFVEVSGFWGYGATSNSSTYNSGHANGNTGSVDYFPTSEVSLWDICGNLTNGLPQLYFDPNATPQQNGHWSDYAFYCNYSWPNNIAFQADLVHPPSYILLDSPLLNYDGVTYAGYYTNGVEQGGIEHNYYIDETFDLKLINPSERIIYNPSSVTISSDLTFPCKYQFLTLKGKYADRVNEYYNGSYSKSYWDTIPYFSFPLEREYPVPINSLTNASDNSIYTLDGATIIIEPAVIIMDAHFKGVNSTKRGHIKYDPNVTYGNWSYDPNTVDITLLNYGENIVFYECFGSPHDSLKSESARMNSKNERGVVEHVKVLNSGSKTPKIVANIMGVGNTILSVYNSSGLLVIRKDLNGISCIVDCKDLTTGIYYIVFSINGSSENKMSFAKL